MSHEEILNYFLDLFGVCMLDIDEWFPNGKNSIRVRLCNDDEDALIPFFENELIFTIEDDSKWKLETVDYYVASLSSDSVIERRVCDD